MNVQQRATFQFPPLKEVAFEINFDSRLKIEAKISNYQDKIIEDLPKFAEEHSLKGFPEMAMPDLVRGMGTRLFVFENEQRSEILKISSSNFNYVTKQYVSFDTYKQKLKEFLDKFNDIFKIERFKRIGLRYINNIEIDSQDGIYDFTKYVKPVLNLDSIPLSEVITGFAEIRLKKDDKKLTIRSGLIGEAFKREVNRKVGIYVLDLDCYKDEEAESGNFDTKIDEFHEVIETEFLNSVTEEYKEIMRGRST